MDHTETQPSREPAQTQPSREPAQTQPSREPAQTQPSREPAQTQPSREPAQTQPSREPAQTQPAREQTEQPVGEPTNFTGATPPEPTELRGTQVILRPIDPENDAESLYAVSHPPAGDPTIWTYLYDGPYPDLGSFRRSLEEQRQRRDYLFLTVTDRATGKPMGIVSYLSIVPEHGVIEIGNIWFSPELQRTRAATETIFLLAQHAFDDLGYRRLEWKCNALNQPSRDAAIRFGFHFEGVFLNHRVVKGRNRDTAWFAITDQRWPQVRAAFEQWLAPENFDAHGNQRSRLRDLTATV